MPGLARAPSWSPSLVAMVAGGTCGGRRAALPVVARAGRRRAVRPGGVGRRPGWFGRVVYVDAVIDADAGRVVQVEVWVAAEHLTPAATEGPRRACVGKTA